MAYYIWNRKFFGDNAPENWEEIMKAVNGKLKAEEVAGKSHDELVDMSRNLWDEYLENNEILGIEIENEACKNIWYAYQGTEEEREEAAWDGDGTKFRPDAEDWLIDQYNAGNKDAVVDVVHCDEDWGGDFCEDILTTDDI